MRFRTLSVVVVVALAVLYSSVSEAGRRRPRRRGNFDRKFLLGGDFALVAGGTWTFDTGVAGEEESDMEVGFGFDVLGEYNLMRYFRAGLQVGMIWVRNEYWQKDGRDRMYVLDISARFRVPFLLWHDRIMAYAMVPIGFTLANPDDNTPVSPTNTNLADTGYGLNVGGYLGVQFFLASQVAAHINLGVLYHWWEWDSRGPALEVDTKNSFVQFAMQIGFDYAL
jgi:hypothetical protein